LTKARDEVLRISPDKFGAVLAQADSAIKAGAHCAAVVWIDPKTSAVSGSFFHDGIGFSGLIDAANMLNCDIREDYKGQGPWRPGTPD
jgi:hypothetical protein